MVAFMPEPQTLLTVVAPVASGSLAPRAAWRGRGLALAGGQHVAHEHLVDALGRESCALQRRADHMRAELVRRQRRELAHEAAERGAGGGEDDDGIGAGCHGRSPFNAGVLIELLSSYDAMQKMQLQPS
ncbi:hypothetical protein ABIF27_008814 [Bradyrhizobium elkanii]